MNSVSLTKAKKILMGSNEKRGLVPAAIIYLVLFSLAYVYLLPVLRMAVTSVMSQADVVDPTVVWVPREIHWENYQLAYKWLYYKDALITSIFMSVVPALLQTVCTAFVGYGFARFDFPFKKLLFVIMIVMLVIPTQLLTTPRFLLYSNLGWTKSLKVQYIPAILGQGIRSSIFILIFYNFFSTYPKSFDEAAEIDGCSRFKIFYKIAVPMAGPAFVIGIIFSVVWYWNETTQSSSFFGNATNVTLFGFIKLGTLRTLPMRLADFTNTFASEVTSKAMSGEMELLDSHKMAAALLATAPLLIFYLLMQRNFVESVERSGITGE